MARYAFTNFPLLGMVLNNTVLNKVFYSRIDNNFNELYTTGDINALSVPWNPSYTTMYVENVFTGSDLTQVNYYTDATKALKLFTKDITYTGGNPTSIVLKDEITGKLLTTTIAYTGYEVLNVTKVLS